MERSAEIGVFGGSGFYSFLPDVHEVVVETPYGPPSDRIALAEVAGRKVAFLPRHGKDHRLPPHRINYRANVYAMKQLGVTRIIGPCASGSLQARVKPGDFVICDQFVNRTWGRDDTFYEGPIVTHMSAADPYCPVMRKTAIAAAKALDIPVHETGTIVVIQGPRFSTRAESREYRDRGWEVINMSQYPEVILARELEMCYLNISLITDYDAGLEGDPAVEPVSHEAVLKAFAANNERLKQLLLRIIADLPAGGGCLCGTALKSARA